MKTLTLETAPAALPITTAEAREQLRIDGTGEDTTLDRLIGVAVAYMDGQGALGRSLITQSWGQWFYATGGEVRLEMGPFQSLTSVQYYDAAGSLQTASLGNYETVRRGDDIWLRPKDGASWPSQEDRPDAIKATYVAGYGDAASDVPESIRHALLMLVSHWFERREPSNEKNMMDIPWGVEALVNIERTRWYG